MHALLLKRDDVHGAYICEDALFYLIQTLSIELTIQQRPGTRGKKTNSSSRSLQVKEQV
jgi:hypothetical protein